ncbi:MAG: hypothetical protein WCH39_23540 [Schlesneria sp.]
MLKGIHLTLLIGPGSPNPMPGDVLNALTDVSVQIDSAGPSGFELKFTWFNGLDEKLGLGRGTLPGMLRVVIAVTMQATPQVLMDGIVSRHSMSPGGARGTGPTLTLQGEDLTRAMNYTQLDGVPFPGQSPENRVSSILRKYSGLGIRAEVVAPVQLDLELPTNNVGHQKGTDLQYINHLAKCCGHIFYIEPGPQLGQSKAYWGPEIRNGEPQPALTADMDSFRNVDTLDCSVQLDDRREQVINVEVPGLPLAVNVPLPDVASITNPLARFQLKPQGQRKVPDTSNLSPTKALLKGLQQSQQAQEQVSVSGSLDVMRYGQILQARRLVGVRGVGPLFNGNYFVRSVSHAIRRGEYKQSFQLSRGGVGASSSRVNI